VLNDQEQQSTGETLVEATDQMVGRPRCRLPRRRLPRSWKPEERDGSLSEEGDEEGAQQQQINYRLVEF
jgi:hypothetical protein